MAYRTLDLTLISAKDLKNVNLFTQMRVYAIITISYDGPRSRQRIAPDRDGGRNPNWNATIHFTIPAGDPGNHLLRILLRADRVLGDRDVGFVQIPLRDIIATPGDTRFVSYQVRRPLSGKPKGVLNFSYKISDPITPPSVYPHLHFVAPPAAAAKLDQEPVIAYPPAEYYAVQQPYGYGAPAMPAGYGYSPAGYGYSQAGYGVSGMGLAAGIVGGAVGGLLIGDMISGGLEAGSGF
ncbi:protein SRC2-like [Phalaenopsis equestris]|uniref:protein SRC2-like n=1 Tax=Phalaenopsis equestris TaxID=78828 RepID=UPI0009E38364|nr:protein SRC2-like [Phalaenopsis equestris]